ncbi:MAG TPA: glycosyltransferase [Gemmatimonadales bacterium]|nr:glycosyltransferase [Gemmatimonadales bacterium]
MRDRIRTLYLDANGCGRQVIRADTVLRGVFGYRDGAAPPWVLRRSTRAAELFSYLRQFQAHVSYTIDWREAFCEAPELDVEVCNINNLVHYGRCLLTLRRYDLVVVSHAAAGDDMTVLLRSAHWLRRRRGKLVMFIGNEYDLLDEKIGFIEAVGAEFICSQLPTPAARYLYRECGGSRILSMPHALNPKVYQPRCGTERPVDIGFIGDVYWPFVGDRERTDLIEAFERDGARWGLKCQIRKLRIARAEWAGFLNTCKGTIGAESGTYYLNDRGRLLAAAREYNLLQHREASFDEVFEKFYRGQPREVSGKSISSRHFEPIGTKTCQILLEGEYNGVLAADEHYISVRKDRSNLDEAVRRFRDEGYRQTIAERAYEHVMTNHTYAHRVRSVLAAVGT